MASSLEERPRRSTGSGRPPCSWRPAAARGRWLVKRPLVEAAACVLLTAGGLRTRYDAPQAPSALEVRVRARAGETLACAPLIALALARGDSATGPIGVTGEWRGRRAGLYWH